MMHSGASVLVDVPMNASILLRTSHGKIVDTLLNLSEAPDVSYCMALGTWIALTFLSGSALHPSCFHVKQCRMIDRRSTGPIGDFLFGESHLHGTVLR